MTEETILPAASPTPNIRSVSKIFQAVYILYLLSLLFPFLGIAGLIFVYVFRTDATLYLKSHAQYLIRSFWIGLLYSVIAGVLCFILIGFILLFILFIWWLIRMITGLRLLLQEKEISDPTTWWLL